MRRHTGGTALGATSTRSVLRSRAIRRASKAVITPSCSPASLISRTSLARICSFTRKSLAIEVLLAIPILDRPAHHMRNLVPHAANLARSPCEVKQRLPDERLNGTCLPRLRASTRPAPHPPRRTPPPPETARAGP